jgi:hypothetical protein
VPFYVLISLAAALKKAAPDAMRVPAPVPGAPGGAGKERRMSLGPATRGVFAGLLFLLWAGVGPAVAGGLKIAPPRDGCYLGLHDWTGGGAGAFEKLLGTRVAIHTPSYVRDETGSEGPLPRFDRAGHERAFQEGYVTFYGIEYRIPSETISPQAVIEGKLDAVLAGVAREVKAWGRPLFWLYQREPRIQPGPTDTLGERMGFGYDGGGYGPRGDETYAGVLKRRGDPKADYGDPAKLDGPERYVDAARHIHAVVESIAPEHVTWVAGASVDLVMVVTEMGIPNTAAKTTYADFYPGDGCVDWHAFNFYSTMQRSFAEEIGPVWHEIKTVGHGKPVMMLEFGVYRTGGQRAAWFRDFFEQLAGPYRRIRAVLYWQAPSTEGEDERTAILEGDAAAAVWRKELAGGRWPGFGRCDGAAPRPRRTSRKETAPGRAGPADAD